MFIANARDTIRRLRNHPSLLLWCGGNELNPDGKNPNPDVARGIKALLAELDPLRYYVPSSMSTQSIDPASFDVEFALAPTVGIALPPIPPHSKKLKQSFHSDFC